jgi:ATP-binding cassette subfamily F protein 3
MKKIEEQMEVLQQKKVTLETDMAKPEVFENYEKLQKVQVDFQTVDSELKKLEGEWEKIATSIDELSGK